MRGRLAFAFAAAGTGWSILLIAGTFVFAAYSGQECRTTPSGEPQCVAQSATDFEMNGWRVAAMFAAVAIVSLLVMLALHRVCTTGSGIAAGAAWAGIALLFGFSWLTGLSIGILVLPAAALLTASAFLTPRPVLASA